MPVMVDHDNGIVDDDAQRHGDARQRIEVDLDVEPIVENNRYGQVGNQALTSILVIIGLNIIIGFTQSGIDNAAHLGGLVAGAAMAYAVSPREKIMVNDGSFYVGALPGVGMTTTRPGYSRLIMATAAMIVIAVALTVWWSSVVEYSQEEMLRYLFLRRG